MTMIMLRRTAEDEELNSLGKDDEQKEDGELVLMYFLQSKSTAPPEGPQRAAMGSPIKGTAECHRKLEANYTYKKHIKTLKAKKAKRRAKARFDKAVDKAVAEALRQKNRAAKQRNDIHTMLLNTKDTGAYQTPLPCCAF
eukprot:2736317-Pyramimonas_sp.AAC.1